MDDVERVKAGYENLMQDGVWQCSEGQGRKGQCSRVKNIAAVRQARVR